MRPVNSFKHIVESNGAVSAANASITDLVVAVTDPKPGTSPTECNIASTVGAIFLNVQVVGEIGAGGVDNIYMAVVKNPGNNFVFPDVDLLGISDLRKYVIHQEMIMTGQAGGNPGAANIARTMFKGVILIPRGYKRNGFQDRIQVILQHRSGEQTQVTNFCIEAIYKEFQ